MSGAVALHSWNRDFTWHGHRATSGAVSQDQVDQFDRDGFFVIPGLLGRAELERTVSQLDALEADSEAHLRTLPEQRYSIAEAGAITFTTHVVTRSDWLRRLSVLPRILGVCSDLVGPDVRLYWDQAVYKKPEKPRRFPWHQDNGYNFVEPQEYLTVWIALTDAVLANGCPQVARGVHRLGTLRHRFVDPLGFQCFPDHDDVAAAEVPAGGAVVFSSLTPHLTGPNTTDTTRKAYILQYAPVGAAMLRGDTSGPPTERVKCDAFDRQYQVLRAGAAVDPPLVDPSAAASDTLRRRR